MFAKSEAVWVHSPSRQDSVLESADEFDRKVAALHASEKVASFLEARSKETPEISLHRVRRARGVGQNRGSACGMARKCHV
jgi:hypothetical protein